MRPGINGTEVKNQFGSNSEYHEFSTTKKALYHDFGIDAAEPIAMAQSARATDFSSANKNPFKIERKAGRLHKGIINQ